MPLFKTDFVRENDCFQPDPMDPLQERLKLLDMTNVSHDNAL